MHISGRDRRAFSHWIRTGQWPGDPVANGIEHKFNPYHDPRNGQFTFAPGGPRSLSHVVISYGRREKRHTLASARRTAHPAGRSVSASSLAAPSGVQAAQAVYRPSENPVGLVPASSSRDRRPTRGSNSGAFQDPMTLEQVFPGLRNAPAGGIVAVADTFFDLTGPSRAANAAIVQNWSNRLIEQIKAIEPGYRYDSFGFPQTFQGQMQQLNTLRWTRASLFAKAKGELRPLQVEALRFVQDRTDRAYADGLKLLQSGKLPPHPTAPLALGNYIDRRVRRELRQHYDMYGINSAGKGPVRVNRREYDSSSESTYRQPDSRIGQVAFDVTLQRKGPGTDQVRGFFSTDFKPSYVIIVRPSQLGANHTYAIPRPKDMR